MRELQNFQVEQVSTDLYKVTVGEHVFELDAEKKQQFDAMLAGRDADNAKVLGILQSLTSR